MAIDNRIDSVSLYAFRHIALRGAIFPLIVLYLLWSYICFSFNGIGHIYFVGSCAIAITQVLCLLCCYWSVSFRCLLLCRRVTSLKTASLIKVIPIPNNGFTELVVLNTFKDHNLQTVTWFRYQEIKYLWNDNKKCFHSLQFPIANTIVQYINCKGYTSDEQLAKSIQLYGLNEFNIQLPKFNDLILKKATDPFLVFQMSSITLCTLLWFDNYIYYSIITFETLVLFEFLLVHLQLNNTEKIINMYNKSINLFVYRNKKWQTILSDQLTPGDMVSITGAHDDQTVPCDLLLLRGSCIVDESSLNGESIPQMKEPIENIGDHSRNLDFETDKKLHILFSGTRVVQHTSPIKSTSSINTPPDNGCIAFVLRTGFNTSQGKLLQRTLFGVKHVTANNLETLAFISFLLIFAIAAATYLWIKGIEDPNRSRYILFIKCSLIMTSVIPPELPLELALAISLSISSLLKVGIYCTEAFRIPFAGKVDICCFDKTGTLTKDNLIVEGIAGINNEIIPMVLAPEHTIQVLASCHSLVQLDDTLVGDPIEKSILNALNWLLCTNDSITLKFSKITPLKIVTRFYFSSSLKRMSVLASYTCPKKLNKVVYIASVKGAPEVLKSMLKNIPSNYDCTYFELAGRGARVLALARKEMKFDQDDVQNLKREALECDLDFVGFVVVSCPLKDDSKNVIKELQESSHMVTMITGDSALTACYVANKLNFTRSQSSIILTLTEVNNTWYWVNDCNKIQLLLMENIKKLVESYDLCLTGDSLAYLNKNHKDVLEKILPYVCVFARVAPNEKEFIIIMLKALGYCTLMCGDGTNDVGALKHANVSIAIIARSNEKLQTNAIQLSEIRKSGIFSRFVCDTLKHLMEEMEDESVVSDSNLTVMKSADASIAAAFTSEYSSVTCVCHVIKLGRYILVMTLQMFKIVALKAIITTYSQSILYVKGIMLSDSQVTLQGFLLAFSYILISMSNPLKVLSKQRPLPNIFNIYTILTIMFQCIVHFFSLVFLVQKAGMYVELEGKNTSTFNESLTNSSLVLTDNLLSSMASFSEKDIVKEFTPNIINSTVFIISIVFNISIFSVNYQGRPFMENISENKLLLYHTIIQVMVVLCLSMGIIEGINVQLEVIQFPYEFRVILLSVLVLDCFVSFAVDRICLLLFGEGKLKKIATQ